MLLRAAFSEVLCQFCPTDEAHFDEMVILFTGLICYSTKYTAFLLVFSVAPVMMIPSYRPQILRMA